MHKILSGFKKTLSLLVLLFSIIAISSIAIKVAPAYAQAICPCSIWASSAVPAIASHTDTGAVELGVKFRSDVSGTITGIRFYKGSANTGTHVGSLWTTGGTRLARATFTGETATGWQQVTFTTPVAVTANTTYIASYHAPRGRYAINNYYFATTGVDNPPLHALRNGVSGGNGAYRYSGTSSVFPNSTYQSSNYWVDVVFTTTNPTPTPTVTPVPTATPVPTTTLVPTATPVPTTTPTALPSPTPTSAPTPPPGGTTYTLWSNTTVPATQSDADSAAVELGVKFTSSASGYITGIRFYKGSANTGTHTGTLWSATGTQLAMATFTNETASGWQQVNFTTPVLLTANTTYVASYHAPVGRYAINMNYFSTAYTNTPLQALASSTSGGNGVYRYGASGFPTATWNASNYWVDVVFTTDSTLPSPTLSPTPSATPTPIPSPTATPTPTPDLCSPTANAIACENSKPGNPSAEWNVSGTGSTDIQGFATDISVNKGETVRFNIKTPATAYRLDIYRMGYYQGNGARKITTVNPTATLPQTQPACLTVASTGLIDCGNWAESASWAVPADAVSGIYFAKLVRTDATTGTSHVVFIVRDDAGTSDILFQTADTTWQAYNSYGGNSLYIGSPAGRAYKVSYNRPFNTRGSSIRDWVFNAEYPMVRWLESNGYDVSYFTDIDTDRYGSLLTHHKLFLSVGHDEYWSGNQRTNVENARNAGVNLAFFSGNEVFWKTRWENSIDSSNTPYRTLVSYKETHANAKIDPSPEWTGTWRDPRFSPPSDGGRPENALTGTLFTVNGDRTDAITVPGSFANLRFWRNTAIVNLTASQTATFPAGTLGYEWDEDKDNGFRPAGLLPLSSTTLNVNGYYIQDYGSTYGNGTATHKLTLYKHPSGALVFGTGTVQWSWGLDANHDNGSAAANTSMKQATVNIFADMLVQPTTLQTGLVPATASQDATTPASIINNPANGATLTRNVQITISGVASDTGGVIGAVEVSTNNGTTWHPASGRANWTYNWTPNTAGTYTIMSRSLDDSANLQATPTSVTVTVQ